MAERTRESIEELFRRAAAAKAHAGRMASMLAERRRAQDEARRRAPAVKSVTGTQAPTSRSPTLRQPPAR